MANIKVETHCNNCGYKAMAVNEHNSYECPECRSNNVIRHPYIECECGDYVYLNSRNNTNQCECGKLYNNFGQELSNGLLTDPLDYMD